MKKSSKSVLYVNFIILAVAVLFYVALASPHSVTAMAQPAAFPVYRGSSGACVSLQCTVTWDARALEPILDELKKSGVSITFAVSGEWAEDNPGLLKRMADDGHEIAVMGYCPQQDGGESFIIRDVEASLAAVESITGARPLVYCCGTRDPEVSARAGASLGLTTVLCTIDLDCASADGGLVAARLKGCVSAGGIINIQPTGSLLEALPQIVKYLKNMGLTIVPVHKMLYN